MKVISIEGVELKYRTLGQGPTLILFHGFGGGPADWTEVVAILSQNYEVIVPNLAGLFTSSDPLSFSRQVEILCQFIEGLQKDRKGKLHLAGVSYGGLLSWGVRVRRQDLMGSHVLINPMPFSPLESLRSPLLRGLLHMAAWPSVLRIFSRSPWGLKVLQHLGRQFRMGIAGQKRLKHFNERKIRLLEKAILRFNWVVRQEDWLGWKSKQLNSEISTLLVYSTGDPLFSGKEYSKFTSLLESCEVKTIRNSSHLVVKSHGKEIAEAIAAHVSKCPSTFWPETRQKGISNY